MKRIVFFLCLITALNSHSQDFTFKRVSSQGLVTKMSGEISISDSVFIITIAGNRVESPIEITLKKENFLSFKIKNTGDIQVRYFLQQNVFDNKNEKYTLTEDYKDEFRQTIITTVYFLIPKLK
jgi:hypothetical protein